MRFDVCILLLLTHFIFAMTAQDEDLISTIQPAPSLIGQVTLPSGSTTWRSASKWKGVHVSGPTVTNSKPLPGNSVLLFDENDVLRMIRRPGTNGVVDCVYFSAEGQELTKPSYPPAVVRDRQIQILPIPADSPLATMVDDLKSKTAEVGSQFPLSSAEGNHAVSIVRSPWVIGGLYIPPSAVFETLPNEMAVEFVLLDYGTLNNVLLPPGTCLRAYSYAGATQVVSTSPQEVSYQNASIAPSSFVFWNSEIQPQSFLISKPLQFGTDIFPAMSHIGHFTSTDTIVRPPVAIKVHGITVNSQAYTRFEGTDLAETWLADEWEFKPGQMLPKDTHVWLEGDTLLSALVPGVVTINGLDFKGMIRFYSDGTLKLGVLAKQTDIQGIPCSSESVYFGTRGTLLSCNLAANATLNGINLRPGKFETTEDGALLQGTLNQALTIGTTQFVPGSVLNGVVGDSATISLIDTQGVKDFETDVSNKLDNLIPEIFDQMRNSQNIFGNYSKTDIALVSKNKVRESHGFVNTRKYAIRNFLKNPPFAGCDCRVELEAEVSWSVDQRTRLFKATSGLRPGSKIRLECNFCPVTTIGMAYFDLTNPFYTIDAHRKDVVSQKVAKGINEKRKVLLELLTGREKILPYTVELEDIFLDGSEIKAKCSFLRSLR